MTVTSDMHVTYYLEPDKISRNGLCFEPADAGADKLNAYLGGKGITL